MENILVRINKLYATSKTRELSDLESNELKDLRKEYVKLFREGFEQQLQNTKVVDENGNDITPYKKKMNNS